MFHSGCKGCLEDLVRSCAKVGVMYQMVTKPVRTDVYKWTHRVKKVLLPFLHGQAGMQELCRDLEQFSNQLLNTFTKIDDEFSTQLSTVGGHADYARGTLVYQIGVATNFFKFHKLAEELFSAHGKRKYLERQACSSKKARSSCSADPSSDAGTWVGTLCDQMPYMQTPYEERREGLYF